MALTGCREEPLLGSTNWIKILRRLPEIAELPFTLGARSWSVHSGVRSMFSRSPRRRYHQTRKEQLNVDLLKKILDQRLPPENRDQPEEYAELMEQLTEANIRDAGALIKTIDAGLAEVVAQDARIAAARNIEAKKAGQSEGEITAAFEGECYFTDVERPARGVFWTHVGLMRRMLVQSGLVKRAKAGRKKKRT